MVNIFQHNAVLVLKTGRKDDNQREILFSIVMLKTHTHTQLTELKVVVSREPKCEMERDEKGNG